MTADVIGNMKKEDIHIQLHSRTSWDEKGDLGHKYIEHNRIYCMCPRVDQRE